jgi:hypothetical protein
MGGASDVRRRLRVYLSAVTVKAMGKPASSRTTAPSSRVVSTLLCGTRWRFRASSSRGMLV